MSRFHAENVVRSISLLILTVAAAVGFSQTPLRIVASNTSSGNYQQYETAGIHILQALRPDVALMQEFNVGGTNDTAAVNAFVASTFGSGYTWYREPVPGANIPNGIVSKYPILAAGEWDDTTVSDRDFVWARIDIPGPIDLYVISVHLLTSSSGNRDTQAGEIINTFLPTLNVPANAYVAVGGDFNTSSRTEACISTFSAKFVTSSPYPVGQDGNYNTNAGRSSPYDWVLASPTLNALKTSTVFGSFSYANGLVFDTRDFTQTELNAAFSPALVADSGASSMQHMAIVRTFTIPAGGTVTDGDSATVSASSVSPATLTPGTDAAMLAVTVNAATNEWDASTIKLNKLGTLGDADVTVKVYLDVNGDGALGVSDTLLGSSVLSGGSATVSLSPEPRATPTAPLRLLAVASVSGSAADGATLQLQLAANGLTHSSTGGNDLDPVSTAVSSAISTVVRPVVVAGPSVVINKYFNMGTAIDIVELLVVQDRLDMRGMIIKDFSSSMGGDGGGKYTFSTASLWSSLRAGTLIILRNSNTAADVTVGGADYTLDVGLGNTSYFTNSGGTFDIGTADMVMIKSAGSDTALVSGSIHCLAGGAAGTQYTNTAVPKLRAATGAASGQYVVADNSQSLLSNFTDGTGTATGGLTTGVTWGAGNNASNQAFINFLRGTPATTASGIGNGSFTANWTSLPTAASYRLDVATDASFVSYVTGYRDRDAGSATSYAVSGLSGGTYYYRVRGINAEGTVSGNNNSAMVTTLSSVRDWTLY